MSKSDVDVPEGYKMTELGSLPEEWEVVSVGDINLGGRQTVVPEEFPDEVFEYYSIPAYQDSRKPALAKGRSIHSQKLVLAQGAVLFGKLNPRVEKVWRVEANQGGRQIGSTEWLPVVPDTRQVCGDFVYYLLWSDHVMPVAKQLVTGSTPSRQRVDPASFYRIRIPLPPLPEQKRIAAVLSAVQEAKEKTEAVIQAARELKKSLLKYLFTYGPVPVDEAENVPLKKTEIGEMPQEWGVSSFGDVAEVNREGRNPTKDARHEFLTYIDIASVAEDAGGIVATTRILGKNAPSRARRVVREGDVILSTVRPYLQSFALVGPENDGDICSTGFAVLTAKASALPAYIFYAALTPAVGQQFAAHMRGANYPALNVGHVEQTKLALPPLAEQNKIAAALSHVDGKIAAEEERKRALEELFKTLLNDLMTAKIRVHDLEVEV